MLIIRKAQMDALTRAFAAGFEKAALADLRVQYPEKCAKLGDEECERLVRIGVAKAKSYGITREHDVSAYIDLTFEYSPDFDTTPELGWTRAVLRDPELTGTTKMTVITSRLEAKQKSNASEAK